jgi:serine/threonine protein kinase/tetratricopeptide (TPR) repeat protein
MNRSMTAVASDPKDWARSGSLAPGEVLAGRYRIDAFLGRGAVGEVYEAFDRELGEAIAVKILRPEIARDERALQRFKREIQLARRVTHPNVCRAFDLVHHTAHVTTRTGEEPPGEPPDQVFLTMELLRGETLEQLLARQGRMGMAEALPVIGHIVAALAAAHANGVVHRDLKSGNIFLVPEPWGTRAVVTDFGLAWSSIETNDSASLTATGELVGSPAYMAPEQVRGEEATPATDIYALGVVLFEMVTGELPFVGKSAFYTALKRLQEPAPSPRLHLSDLDPAWEKTILRCLEREPAKRFPTVRHVLQALGRTKAEADATSPLRLIESGVRRLRRRRRLKLELGALALFLAASGLLWAWRAGHLGPRGPFSHQAAPAASPAQTARQPGPAIVMRPLVAVLPFESLAGKGDSNGRAAFELLPLELAASGNLRVVPAAEVDEALRDLGGAGPVSASDPRLLKLLGADFLVTGACLPGATSRCDAVLHDVRGGRTMALSATGETALAALGEKLRRALGAPELVAVDAEGLQALLPNPGAAGLWARALHRLRRGDAPAARDLLGRAVAADGDNPLLHSALAETWAALGYTGKAQQEAKQTLTAMLREEDRLALEARYHELSQEWNEAAILWRELAVQWPDDLEGGLRQAAAEIEAGRPDEAEATLARLRRLPPPAGTDPRLDLTAAHVAMARKDLHATRAAAARAAAGAEPVGRRRSAAEARLLEAGALIALKELAGARQEVSEARQIYVALGDPGGAAEADCALARLHFVAADPDAARGAYAEAVATYRRMGADGEAAKVLKEAGNAYNSIHELDRAAQYYRQARSLSARVGDRLGEAANLHNLANNFLQRGELSAAEPLFRQTLVLHRQNNFPAGEAATLQGLAQIAFRQGRATEARMNYQQALDIYRRTNGNGNAAAVLNNLAEVSLDVGDLPQSRREREEARRRAAADRQEDGVARADRGIADVLRQQGDLAAARALYERSLATYERLSLPGKQAGILDEIGVTLTLQGELVEALKRFGQALDITRQRGDRPAEAEVLVGRARALWRWDALREATPALEQALATVRAAQEPRAVIEALLTLALVKLDLGDRAAARRSFEEALRISRRRGARSQVAAALAGLGALQLAQGETVQARTQLEQALKIRTELGEKLNRAESRLALAEVTLSENHAAQAEAESRAALAEFKALANPPGENAAVLFLARCLLAQNKTAQAGEVLAGAAPLLDASQEPRVRKAAAELRRRVAR